MLSSTISKPTEASVNFDWAPFPVEMSGVSAIVPSPSASKLVILRNPDTGEATPSRFEIWSSSRLEKEFHIPQSKHGSVYTDGWWVKNYYQTSFVAVVSIGFVIFSIILFC